MNGILVQLDPARFVEVMAINMSKYEQRDYVQGHLQLEFDGKVERIYVLFIRLVYLFVKKISFIHKTDLFISRTMTNIILITIMIEKRSGVLYV